MKYLDSIRSKRLQSYLLDYTENDLHRHSMQEEDAVFHEIEIGDVSAVEKRITSADVKNEINSRVGKMADSPRKSLEYMVCISVALASRAAVRGGMDQNLSYTLTDLFLRYLEKCNTTDSIIKLQKDAMLIFAEQVAEVQSQRSRYEYIEATKNYIARHLNKPFTLDDLSQAVNLNKSYLSRKFTEEVGVSIMHYVKTKRIEASKNLLRFSDASIPQIAAYLCFSTQSHFGKVFKEFTGQSPRQFRNRVHSEHDPYTKSNY